MTKIIHQVGAAHISDRRERVVYCTCGEEFEGWATIKNKLRKHIEESNA